MATTARIERTDIPGAVPNVTDPANTSYIEPGALFINVTDQILYSSNGTGYFEVSGSSVADNEFIHDSFIGNGANTEFTLSTPVTNSTSAFVYINGVAQQETTDYSISNTTLTFVIAPALNDEVHTVLLRGLGSYNLSSFTGDGSTTNFTLATPTTTKRTFVTINGISQVQADDYYISGVDVVFEVAPAIGDSIAVRTFTFDLEANGSNTHVQFNDSNYAGGSAGFTFNKTTNNVSIANTLTVANFRLSASNPPINANDPGTAGTIAWDSSYIYVCVATNTWKRVALATWP